MNKNNKPAIRFKGFTEPWEQRKVRELIEDYTEKTVIQNQYPVLTSSQQQGIVFQEEYFSDRQVTTNDNIGYYVLPPGYFTYRSRSDTDVFVFNRNNLEEKGIISYFYPVFAPYNCDSDFLLRRLNYGIRKQLVIAAEGTGQKVLSHNKFKNMIVDVPQKEEQKQIGRMLENIDHLITLNQRKYEKLQKMKKACLEKMFPKEGSAVPEIRFKGFTEPWEQRKLGDVAIYRRGSFPQPYGKSEWYDGDGAKPFVQVADVSNEMNLVEDTKQKISKLAQPMSVFAEKNSVLVTLQGSIGRVAITQYGAFVDRTVLIFEKYKVEIDNAFWAYIIKQKFVDEARKAPGGTIKTITKEALSDFDLSIPNYQEQKQIGAFFRNLDHLITLHEQELEKLQNIKKSCLDKMFV